MCTRVSSSYLNLTGRRGSLCGECEPPPRQGSSARTAHSRTAGAREPVKLWGREGAGASRAAPKALALPWNPSKTSPRKSLCGARQRRRKIHSPDEAMKRCISWCVSPPLECPLLASRGLGGVQNGCCTPNHLAALTILANPPYSVNLSLPAGNGKTPLISVQGRGSPGNCCCGSPHGAGGALKHARTTFATGETRTLLDGLVVLPFRQAIRSAS